MLLTAIVDTTLNGSTILYFARSALHSQRTQYVFLKLVVKIFVTDKVKSLTDLFNSDIDVLQANIEVEIKLLAFKHDGSHHANILLMLLGTLQLFLVLIRCNSLNLDLYLSIDIAPFNGFNLVHYFLGDHLHLFVFLLLQSFANLAITVQRALLSLVFAHGCSQVVESFSIAQVKITKFASVRGASSLSCHTAILVGCLTVDARTDLARCLG
jgi:hypothetical protein